ncbi:hypothetical protein [Phreatobacter sp. AB_2022a]|uniref:hypothetical protein n=1 Tax=Phreatobacter sp. AB_2022a TaxID=3003134 RepID=UPI0022874188|nr:hypothetical protein [Phreatobacter sp. AB_2022a]MCZ0733765.1 hypothetical protein [Phreatobacter sp. AB_2022a]
MPFNLRALILTASVVAGAAAAAAETEATGWRVNEADGQIQAFVSADTGEGPSAGTVYLGFFCGPQPVVRLRVPAPGGGPAGKTDPVRVTFEAGDDLFVATLDAALSAPADGRSELTAERSVIEPADADTLRDFARFLRDAGGSELRLTGAGAAASFTLPLEGAKAALSRYLGACAPLAPQ